MAGCYCWNCHLKNTEQNLWLAPSNSAKNYENWIKLVFLNILTVRNQELIALVSYMTSIWEERLLSLSVPYWMQYHTILDSVMMRLNTALCCHEYIWKYVEVDDGDKKWIIQGILVGWVTKQSQSFKCGGLVLHENIVQRPVVLDHLDGLVQEKRNSSALAMAVH